MTKDTITRLKDLKEADNEIVKALDALKDTRTIVSSVLSRNDYALFAPSFEGAFKSVSATNKSIANKMYITKSREQPLLDFIQKTKTDKAIALARVLQVKSNALRDERRAYRDAKIITDNFNVTMTYSGPSKDDDNYRVDFTVTVSTR